MGTDIDLSIVIVSWNVAEILGHCLRSIFVQSEDLRLEVWVIDNNSGDSTVEGVKLGFPEVHLIVNDENLGFAKAVNRALRRCRSRYQLLLNPDTLLPPGSLSGLVSFMDNHPDVGISGPQLLHADESLQPSCYAFPTLSLTLFEALLLFRAFPKSSIFGLYRMTFWSYDEVLDVDWLSGACLVLRRELLDQIGLLDERFFMYSEDTDLCYRAKQAGWGVCYNPSIRVIHLKNQSAAQDTGQMKPMWAKSYLQFFAKHYGWRRMMIARMILGLGYVIRLVLWSVAYSLPGTKRAQAKRQLVKWWAALKWCILVERDELSLRRIR